ncbi:MAG TPA: DNA polymerase/3'-5' exonuclease PolX, partial [Trueperaceae bacterium]|nr:DNA polymerase/3'-5' exonuclease PolX [Trueperaceae bacterium]
MNISKKQVASQLKEVAKLLDVLGEEPFKARAYTNAIRQIENYEGDFSLLLVSDQLTQLKGIGAGLAAELAHLKEQEIIPSLLDLYERVPIGVRELFLVSGLGAKKVSALWANDIDSLEELIMAADDGRIEA